MATVETTRTTASNGSSAGFKVNEIRSATEEDFQHFVRLADEYKEGTRWTRKLEKNGIAIWQKDTGASPIKMALIVGEFKGVSAGAVFDTVLDGEYRSTWDENVIEDYEICRLDDCNDIGYYSMKCPGPLKNRDFVNQRSWRMHGKDQFVIFNHSVTVKDLPPSKKFIRGVSHITGFLIRTVENGCSVHYVTQSDPKGNIPSWIINLTINKIAPSAFRKLYFATLRYEDWKSQHEPEYKPWRNPEQNKLKIVDPSSLLPASNGSNVEQNSVDGAEEEEEVESLPEETIKELVDQITESLDNEVQNEQFTNGH